MLNPSICPYCQMKHLRWHTVHVLQMCTSSFILTQSFPSTLLTSFFFSTSSHASVQNRHWTVLKQTQQFTFSFKRQVKKKIHPCISCQSNNTPSSWNSGSIALTLFPLRMLWQRTLQGRHVQVVACHWFSGPARVLKLCCVRQEVVSLLDEVH